jgi:hypothetical protein
MIIADGAFIRFEEHVADRIDDPLKKLLRVALPKKG